MRAPISLIMIVCNAEKSIGRCLSSVADHVEEIIIVDTGSDDRTKDMINYQVGHKAGHSAKIFDFTHVSHPKAFVLDMESSWDKKLPGPFSGKYRLCDFAAARQFGWMKGTSEYLMWIDADDTVEHPESLKAITDDMSEKGIVSAILNYDYEHDSAGNVIMRLPRERIIKRGSGSHWEQPVHEVCLVDGISTFYGEVNIVHWRARDKTPPLWHHRNLKILLKWFEEHRKEVDANSVDPRMLFYMGMESRFQWPEYALDCFTKYVRRSGWDEERGQAHFLAGTIHERAGRHDDARAEFSQMVAEFSQNPDGYFGLARTAYHKQQWDKVIEWTEVGFAVDKKAKNRPPMLMEDPQDRKWRPHVFLSAALVNQRQWTRAVAVCNEGLIHAPNDPHLRGNLEAAERELSGQAKPGGSVGAFDLRFRLNEPLDTPPMDLPHDFLVMSAVQLWKRTVDESPERALALIDALPSKLATDRRFVEAKKLTQAKISGEEPKPAVAEVVETPRPFVTVGKQPLKIVIWTGPAWEPWSPTSLKTGIGGSETAAIFMSTELARRGHDVHVLGMHDGVTNDVKYVHHQKALAENGPWKDSDVFITSRQPLVLLDGGFSWRAAYVWCHDIHCGAGADVKTALLKADAVLALSRWHKQHLHDTYKFLGDEHVIATRNGIATGRFGRQPRKEGNKLIYASSPDRGVERLLELFPRIRSVIPNAELEIYYGFETWRSMCQHYGDRAGLDKIAYYERLLTTDAPDGVKYMGRIGQQPLAEAYSRAKIWAYPTWFSETSCISAMEAQAAGCVPVTSAVAALEETVRHGFLLRGADSSREYADEFVSTVVRLLQDETERESYANAGRQWAMNNLGWDLLARDWESMFTEKVNAKGSGPSKKLILPEYAGA